MRAITRSRNNASTEAAGTRRLDNPARRALTSTRLDRTLIARTALLTLLLAWPVLLFGHPAYFADSLSYYKGGRAAVAFVGQRIGRPGLPPSASASAVPRAEKAAAEDAKGARSIPYSVAAYLFRAPGVAMTALALAQALATAFVIASAAAALNVARRRDFTIVALVVATATPAACFAGLVVPDIFAGLLIAILALLATHASRIPKPTRALLVAIGSFAVTAHASHAPLAGGMTLLGAVWLFVAPGGTERGRRLKAAAWLAAPLTIGVLVTLIAGLVGFGEVSLAAKRYPLTLARSIEDGPARWYLARACPTRRYAVCEVFGNEMPTTVPAFLWGETGLTGRATPEQMNRIRAEEQEIVFRAAEAYPMAQAESTIVNVAWQFVRFDLTETQFDTRSVTDHEGELRLAPDPHDYGPVLAVVGMLSVLSTTLGVALVLVRIGKLGPAERAIVMLVLAGLAGNAVICAVFSGVADRYQARVVWLVPLFALLTAFGQQGSGRRAIGRTLEGG